MSINTAAPDTINAIPTHDYTTRGWGHDYSVREVIEGGKELTMYGWGYGLNKGDYLLLQDGKGGATRYRIREVSYFNDPRDMWSADVSFAPRSRKEQRRASKHVGDS